MFYGSFRHSVDPKGRVALPAQFRRDLAGAVVAPGAENRLVIRPAQEWQEYEQNFRLTAESSADKRLFMRHLHAGARPVDIDAQGRILLTPEHRSFAQIQDRAVFVGVSNVVEIVGEQVWDAEVLALNPEIFTELGDRIGTRSRAAADRQ
ncbi:MAG: division/cell wall cluster transcriptional repressor MraZ [Candidatus Dormibacteraeota bacterium]|uniref:Transcriptional regulator MraZ n=1 Tax=Candidatus Amunia macphersoniae TaxID=3127014 RepID=A0A934NFB0_9BACT|nr:division/cell wall cluster transcriptional repressor MraZ [Candidatus Dormibacteraeota bacterium]